MMVATTDGNISITNFDRYFSSIPNRLPRPAQHTPTLRLIGESIATDWWQTASRLRRFISWQLQPGRTAVVFPPRSRPSNAILGFQLDFQEHNLGTGFVEDVVLDPGLAEIGFPDAERRLAALSTRRHDGHFA